MRSLLTFNSLLLAFLVVSIADATDVIHRRRPNGASPSGTCLIRIDTSLVLIPVVVTDRGNRTVSGLERRQFRIFEDNLEQSISHFSAEDIPISVAIVLDESGSMAAKLPSSQNVLAEFLKSANPQDEFALVRVKDRPELIVPFTSDTADLQSRSSFDRAYGRTSLLDGVYEASRLMRKARNPRKAIFVISDGGDNNSRYTASEIRNAVLEADVQIYSIGFNYPGDDLTAGLTGEGSGGPKLLADMAAETGGAYLASHGSRELPEAAAMVAAELHSQYLIAYASTNTRRDGRYRRVKVVLVDPPGPRMKVRARLGYYAPEE